MLKEFDAFLDRRIETRDAVLIHGLDREAPDGGDGHCHQGPVPEESQGYHHRHSRQQGPTEGLHEQVLAGHSSRGEFLRRSCFSRVSNAGGTRVRAWSFASRRTEVAEPRSSVERGHMTERATRWPRASPSRRRAPPRTISPILSILGARRWFDDKRSRALRPRGRPPFSLPRIRTLTLSFPRIDDTR